MTMLEQQRGAPTRTNGSQLVLVVDDARPDRERIVRWLDADARYRVRAAASAPEARAAIADDRPDCVVLDYMLADESGLDLLSELHDDDQPVPVVMVTGAGHSAVAAAALRRGRGLPDEGHGDRGGRPPCGRLGDRARRSSPAVGAAALGRRPGTTGGADR